MSIRRWPKSERPRERLLEQGAAALSDAELLALILGTSSVGSGGVVPAARDLLKAIGGLSALTRMRAAELLRHPGLGPARTCALLAVVELSKRLAQGAIAANQSLVTSSDVFKFVRHRVDHLRHEIFLVIALDARHRPISVTQVAQGSVTSVDVHPREIFNVLIRDHAAAGIVVHNHPSGDVTPSDDDILLTEALIDAGHLLGIPILDHVVIGRGNHRSVNAKENGFV